MSWRATSTTTKCGWRGRMWPTRPAPRFAEDACHGIRTARRLGPADSRAYSRGDQAPPPLRRRVPRRPRNPQATLIGGSMALPSSSYPPGGLCSVLAQALVRVTTGQASTRVPKCCLEAATSSRPPLELKSNHVKPRAAASRTTSCRPQRRRGGAPPAREGPVMCGVDTMAPHGTRASERTLGPDWHLLIFRAS